MFVFFSLGSPVKQVFAGHAIYTVERRRQLLTGGKRPGGWGGAGPVCWASLLDTEDPPEDAGTAPLGCGLVRPRPGPTFDTPPKASVVMARERPAAGGGRGWRRRGCVLWAQLLSLVSEEALPNKMSLSWDMLLSGDLVLRRNWVLRNISLSCSCLSSR